MNSIDDSRHQFWEKRASLGVAAGTNDVNLKELEIENIALCLDGCRCVLDAGCGNGTTAISILKRIPDIQLYGFDYSEAMINEAMGSAQTEGFSHRLTLGVGNLLSPPFENVLFDAIYTERALINLNNRREQEVAISRMLNKVKIGGKVILCESFEDGLNEINSFRTRIGLKILEQPWHNRYFKLAEFPDLIPENAEIERIDNFSSTYYFLSRVINAWFAKCDGTEPSYDAPINKLAFALPSIDLCAQTKIVVLKKHA